MSDRSILVSEVNVKFLSPAWLMTFIVFVFLLCLPLLPVDIKYPISTNAFLFWLSCAFAFAIGGLLGSGIVTAMPKYTYQIDSVKSIRFLKLLILIGFSGIVLLFFDRYVVRGASFGESTLDNRLMLIENLPSKLSLIAAFCSSISIFSYIVIWFIELKHVTVSRWLKTAAVFNVILALILSTELGSRSLLIVTFLIHIICWIFVARYSGARLKLRHKIGIASSFFVLVIISVKMMTSRVELMNIAMQDSVIYSVYAYTMVPYFSIQEVMEINMEFGAILAGLFSLIQYVFHGFYEFGLLFDNLEGDHEWGRRTLWLPIKLFSMLTGGVVEMDQVSNIGERFAVFTTFLGPVFIDFGWLSPLILVVYGWLMGLPFRAMRGGQLEWLPVVVLIAACTILWPVVNILSSASGSYLLVCAVLISLTIKKLKIF